MSWTPPPPLPRVERTYLQTVSHKLLYMKNQSCPHISRSIPKTASFTNA